MITEKIKITTKRITKKQKDNYLFLFMKKQNKILYKWILINYGRRCKDYEEGCIVCKAWKMFEELRYKTK